MVDVYLYPVPDGAPADPWLRVPGLPSTTLELTPAAVLLLAVDPWITKLPPTPGGGLPRDDKPPRRRERDEIVAMSLYEDLVRRYGVTHGTEVYRAMEVERKGPFAPGRKYDPDA